MRRAGDILKDLGFRENASQSTQEAFLKNLIRAAYGADVLPLPPRKEASKDLLIDKVQKKKVAGDEMLQLSFSFEEENQKG